MKFRNYLFILTTMSVIFCSCSKDDSEAAHSSILPLNVGNEWSYIDSTFNYYSGEGEVDTSRMMYGYYYKIGTYSGYTSSPLVNGNPVSLLNIDNMGNLEEYLFLSDTLVFRTVLFKLNAKKGEKWISKSAVYSDYDDSKVTINEREVTCVCTDTIIHTPKGAFTCKGFSYSPNNGKDTFVLYFSENIGLVLSLHYEGNHLFTKSILLDYHLE